MFSLLYPNLNAVKRLNLFLKQIVPDGTVWIPNLMEVITGVALNGSGAISVVPEVTDSTLFGKLVFIPMILIEVSFCGLLLHSNQVLNNTISHQILTSSCFYFFSSCFPVLASETN